MAVSFREFTVYYFILIIGTIAACLFNSIESFFTFILLLLITIGFLIILIKICRKIVHKYGITFEKAKTEELEKEDDVLLEGVGFASSILFFYLSFFSPEIPESFLLSLGLVLFTIPFYLLRAFAKIRNSPKLRYYSMCVFFFLMSVYFLGISLIIINQFFNDFAQSSYGPLVIAPLSGAFIMIKDLSENFKKRYDYKKKIT